MRLNVPRNGMSCASRFVCMLCGLVVKYFINIKLSKAYEYKSVTKYLSIPNIFIHILQIHLYFFMGTDLVGIVDVFCKRVPKCYDL